MRQLLTNSEYVRRMVNGAGGRFTRGNRGSYRVPGVLLRAEHEDGVLLDFVLLKSGNGGMDEAILDIVRKTAVGKSLC